MPVASTVRRRVSWTILMALPVAGLTALRLESAYTVFLSFSMYFVAFWIFGTIAPYRLRFGVAATIALVCWLIFMVGTGFDVTARGGIALFIGAPMVGMLGFSYLIELGERADVARASLALPAAVSYTLLTPPPIISV